MTTDRLRLRLMTPEDTDDVHAYQSLPEVARYQLFEPRTRDEVAARVAENARRDRLAEDGDFLQLAVEWRREAHFVRDLRFKGAWADTLVFAILDTEWAALR